MTGLEWAIDLVARAAAHRLAILVVAAFWAAFRGTEYVDDVQYFFTFIVLHAQGRDGLALQAKADALVKHSSAPDAIIGLERRGTSEIEAARESTLGS